MKELVTYLTFDGTARDAMTFYSEVFDGKLELMTVGQMSEKPDNPEADRVMHAKLVFAQGTLMASDTMSGMPGPFLAGNNFSLSIDCSSAEEQETLFHKLGEGGAVTMPLEDTFWGARFGMVKDRFGIAWMFNFDLPKA